MKKPELEDFGVTPEAYALYIRVNNSDGPSWPCYVIASIVTVSVVVSVTVVTTGDKVIAGWAAFGSLFIIVPVVGSFIDASLRQYDKRVSLRHPTISQIKLYQEAEATYRTAKEAAEKRRQDARLARQAAEQARQRKRLQYWESLSGIQFEREMARLFRALGYHVRLTPTSGDQGIDLVLASKGKTTVVQCKAHNRPVGPSIARELLGSMVAYGAHSAILACTGGFTNGVYEFAQGKPIELVSAKDIVRMTETVSEAMLEIPGSSPTCPVRGCGNEMELRKGRYGVFWGCPKYPSCRGTRSI